MQYRETDKHWNEFHLILILLFASGRRDPVVIALMVTESFFRPALHRSFEYLYWFFLDIVVPKKSKYISVGISQVQVRHWHAAGIISCSNSRFSTLIKFYDPLCNYDACRNFLDIANIQHEQPEELLRKYTGKTTKYHTLIFKGFLKYSLNVCKK